MEQPDATPSGQPPSDSHLLAPHERQERIRERVISEGFVRIEQLVEDLSVSLMTVHRDLDALERQGWLRKVRGGATAQPSALFHGDVRHRMQAMTEAKQALARTALKLVEPGQVLMLDESTTGLHLARLLPEHAPLTAITYFLAVIKLLAGEPGIELIGLGGAYYPAYDAFLGMRTWEAVRTLRADAVFMGTTAITDGACYHQSQDTVLVKRAQMEAAGRRVLMVDHTKFRRRGLYQLAPLTEFDLVLVDRDIDERDLAAVRDLGVTVQVAGAESERGEELLQARRPSARSARVTHQP